MWTPIIDLINSHHHFIISSHINPDCDALGSELALGRTLQTMGKQVTILNTDPVPKGYRFLDPEKLILTYSKNAHDDLISQADAIIVVDASGGWQRLGRVGNQLATLNVSSICIDHHPDGQPFTTVSHVDPTAAAAAELIFDLIATMGVSLTYPIAEALYAGIITDSGNFRFSSTSMRTHQIAAQLLQAGVKPNQLYSLIYQQHSLLKIQLKGYVLQHITLHAGGQIAASTITLDLLKEYQTSSSELDNFSGLAQQIRGVRVAIFGIELPRNRVKISWRSDGSVPVNKVAAQFGGGGHVPAAGATVHGSLDEVMETILHATKNIT